MLSKMPWLRVCLSEHIDLLSTLPPDILLEIARQLTYQDVIRVCQINRNWYYLFGVENFGQIWTFFYRQTISAHRLPSAIQMSTQGCLLREFSGIFKKTRFIQAARRGYERLAQTYLDDLPSKDRSGAIVAVLYDVARFGYDDMLNWLLTPTIHPVDLDFVDAGLAERGNWDLLDRLDQHPLHAELSWRYSPGAIYGAARGGHQEVLKEMLHLDFVLHNSIRGAAEGGHKELLWELLRQRPRYNFALFCVSLRGHAELIPELLNHGANHVNGLTGAAEGGHLEIVEFFVHRYGITYSPKDYRAALYNAARQGHDSIVDYLLTRPDTLFHSDEIGRALQNAAKEGHLKVVTRLLPKLPNQLNQAISTARLWGYPEIAELIETWRPPDPPPKSVWKTSMSTLHWILDRIAFRKTSE